MDGDNTAIRVSLEESDGVWCTNWDSVDSFDIAGVAADAYNAPLEATGEFWTAGDNPYTNISDNLGLVGCTPGIDVP